MDETIINKIIENKIRTLLEIINKNYAIKFKRENIDKEVEYIIKHINIVEYIHKESNIIKAKKTKINILDENRCCARTWNNDIFDRETMLKVKYIDRIFKVIDFKDINIKQFNEKYILGLQCKKSKLQPSDYCKLHSHHLIHGNYNNIPSKEICYHFMKDGKYL